MSRELDEACALAMGWERRFSPDPTIWAWERPSGGRATMVDLPHFSTDCRAARLIEDEIERRGLWQGYIKALGIRGSVTTNPVMYDWYDVACAIRATPEQRARAFLEAIK